jgi:cysteinyl-tRNA synthetase
MATQHLGKQIDIHSGGEDHIQVHHTNEIAQAEAAYDLSPWVRYWLHNSYLLYDGEKVSKSKGGLYTVEELSKKGFEPLAVRYFFLMAHYRKQQSFSLKALEGAQQSLDKLRNIILDLKKGQAADTSPDTKRYKEQFIDAIADDLNMPKALAIVWEVARDKELGDKEKLELLYDFDQVTGLDLKDYQPKKEELSKEVIDLIKKREQAREKKDWKRSDQLRDQLKEKGIIVKDTKEGTEWQKI